MKTKKMPGSLRLKYSAGMGANGRESFLTRTMGNIHPEATDEAVYALKALLAAVQEQPIADFVRSESKTMTQE